MFRGQSHISKFLAAVVEGDPWTRIRIGVAAPPILVIEARPRRIDLVPVVGPAEGTSREA
jgi:hypothetical protein